MGVQRRKKKSTVRAAESIRSTVRAVEERVQKQGFSLHTRGLRWSSTDLESCCRGERDSSLCSLMIGQGVIGFNSIKRTSDLINVLLEHLVQVSLKSLSLARFVLLVVKCSEIRQKSLVSASWRGKRD